METSTGGSTTTSQLTGKEDSPTATPAMDDAGGKNNGLHPPSSSNEWADKLLNGPVLAMGCGLLGVILGLVVYIWNEDSSAHGEKIIQLSTRIDGIDQGIVRIGESVEKIDNRLTRRIDSLYSNGSSNRNRSDRAENSDANESNRMDSSAVNQVQ